MKNNTFKIVALSTFIITTQTIADPAVINNNNAGQPTVVQQCPNANQNNIYDPRVPPAGVYKVDNGNGSTSEVYTTGEKKPYITDNNCNQGTTVSPYVYAQPPGPGPVPGPNPGPRPGPRR